MNSHSAVSVAFQAHAYGERVLLLDDPAAHALLARLCTPAVTQPAFNQVLSLLYQRLFWAAAAQLPTTRGEVETRMITHTAQAVLRGTWTDPATPVVVVDVARAGILPGQIFYDLCNALLDPSHVRQDHLIMARTTDAEHRVNGAAMLGGKIGGRVDDAVVFIPDPMGATGSSISSVIDMYRTGYGAPRRFVAVNLIVTPQYLRTMMAHPDVVVVALRLDRGMSAPDVLETVPGERWDEENGLNEMSYIVPGGGGFGELMNNSWV